MTRFEFTLLCVLAGAALGAGALYLTGRPPERIIAFLAGMGLGFVLAEVGRWLIEAVRS